MKQSILYAGIDIGTSYIKGAIAKDNGNIIKEIKFRSPPVISISSGWMEINVDKYFLAFQLMLKELLKSLENTKIYLGLSTMTPVFIPVDSYGKPLMNGILYNDTRVMKEINEIKKNYGDLIFSENGNVINNQQWIPKFLWLQRNKNEIYKKTQKYLDLTSYIIWKLTKKAVVDQTVVQEEGLLNYRKREISKPILEIVNIGSEQLATIQESKEISAEINMENNVSLIINSGCVDAIAISLSLGYPEEGQLAIFPGTTGIVYYSTKNPKPSKYLFLDVSPKNDLYIMNGGTASAGSFVDYVMDILGITGHYKKLQAMAKKSVPGSKGVIMLPYITGERTPLFDPSAKSVIFGLTNVTTKNEIARASLEAVAFSLKSIIDIINDLQYSYNEIIVAGGLSRMKIMREILAGVLEKKLIYIKGASEIYGDIYLAMIMADKIKWEDLKSMHISSRFIKQEINTKKENIYKINYDKYKKLYSVLKELF
jgi:xylulokinase